MSLPKRYSVEQDDAGHWRVDVWDLDGALLIRMEFGPSFTAAAAWLLRGAMVREGKREAIPEAIKPAALGGPIGGGAVPRGEG